MTSTPAPAQYMPALAKANRTRLARANLKRDVTAGRWLIADVILDPPEYALNMPISELLIALPRLGRHRVRRFLGDLPVSERRTLGQLTERQRREIATELSLFCPTIWRGHVRKVEEAR